MKQHRFYTSTLLGNQRAVVDDPRVLHQWRKVLRLTPSQEVILFNDTHEAVYQMETLTSSQARLQFVAARERQLPSRQVYLVWSLLKRDKNDWIIQKATELGVTHFIPVQAERCMRADISHVRLDRWQKIAVEASEQSGRSDIPRITEPEPIMHALQYLREKSIPIYRAEQGSGSLSADAARGPIAVCIGPEGGWSESENTQFEEAQVPSLELSNFTLRAETAAIVASAHLTR